jgi:hypothetical protein
MLNQDFKEFLQLLNENEVEYLIVGGYAVAFHGYPRYTKDIDIWVKSDKENAQRIIQSLDQFGFGSLGLKTTDFLQPDQIIQLGNPPVRIDLITILEGVNFEECFNSKVVENIDDVDVNFIDLHNLKKNKQALGRPQDVADLEHLE